MTEPSFKEALDYALKVTGRSLREVTDTAGVSYDKFKNLRQGKSRTTSVEDAMKVARAFGVTLEQFLQKDISATVSIPILGRVAAGTEEILMEGQGEPIGEVDLPENLRGKGDIGAVLVEGDSMRPLIPPGSVLFFRRYAAEGVPSEAVGRVCVVEDADGGRVWVKQVTQGSEPGLFNLISINPTIGARLDVPLRWAGPVLLWLPPELMSPQSILDD